MKERYRWGTAKNIICTTAAGARSVGRHAYFVCPIQGLILDIVRRNINDGEEMKKISIYLAGEMSKGTERQDIATWRDVFIREMSERFDYAEIKYSRSGQCPMSYPGRPPTPPTGHVALNFLCPELDGCDHTGVAMQITVEDHFEAIESANLLVAYINREGLYGTLMEIIHALEVGTSVLIVMSETYLSKFGSEFGYDENHNEGFDPSAVTGTEHGCTCCWEDTIEMPGIMSQYWFVFTALKQKRGKYSGKIIGHIKSGNFFKNVTPFIRELINGSV